MVDEQRLDTVIDTAVADQRIVGTVVRVLHHGDLVYERAAGFADREADRAITGDTIFRYDSLTKAFTSVAAMLLVQQGKLNVENSVSKWLPEFQPMLPGGGLADVRLRHLMTHTAGLRYRASEGGDGPYSEADVSDGSEFPSFPMSENLRRMTSFPLHFEPGTAWEYSVATNVLGEVVGRVHGGGLAVAIRELITDPLGCKDTHFTIDKGERLASQYSDGDPLPERMPVEVIPALGEYGPRRSLNRVFDSTAYPVGGGGLIGTASDFTTFIDAVRNVDARLFTPETVTALAQNQIGEFETEPGWGHSFGWAVKNDPASEGAPQSAGTWSWAGGFGNRWFVDPARQLTVVSLTNTSYAGCFGPYPDSIRNAIYGME